MSINKISPNPLLDIGVKSLLSNDNMLAFFKNKKLEICGD